jgi:hypothetical protein
MNLSVYVFESPVLTISTIHSEGQMKRLDILTPNQNALGVTQAEPT